MTSMSTWTFSTWTRKQDCPGRNCCEGRRGRTSGTNKTLDWGNKTGGTAFVSGCQVSRSESTDAKMLSREEQILLDKVVQVARAAVNSKPSTSTPTPTDTPSVNPISNAPSTVEDTKANADNSIHHDGEPKGTASSAGRLDKKKGKAAVKSSGHRGVKRKASEIAHDEPEMVNHTVVPCCHPTRHGRWCCLSACREDSWEGETQSNQQVSYAPFVFNPFPDVPF